MLAALTSTQLRSVVLGYAMMLVVPGPSFLLVVQAGLATHRRHGIVTALGVATGAGLLVLALAVAETFFTVSSGVIEAGRAICVMVLLIAAFRALRSGIRGQQIRLNSPASDIAPFALGVVTALSNPLSLAFFGSATLLAPVEGDPAGVALLPLVVFLMAFSWYGFVGYLIAHSRISDPLRSIVRFLSVGSGIALVLVAGTVALSA